MKTELLHLQSLDTLRTDANVIDRGADELGPYVILDRTCAHPKGGGQQSDTGHIAGVPFIAVLKDVAGEIRHYLRTPLTPATAKVTIVVDEAPRFLHSRWHSAGHLVAAIAEQLLPGVVMQGANQAPGDAWVTAPAPPAPLPEDLLERLNTQLSAVGTAAQPIEVLNDGGARRIRIGAPGMHREVPCGGTHATSTAALGRVEVTKVSCKKGVLRISFALR